MKTRMIIALSLLMLASLACSVNIPIQKVQPGATQTYEVNEAGPDTGKDSVRLNIEMGAGSMNIHPGAENLVEGTIRYNIPEFKPSVEQDSAGLTLKQQTEWKGSIPTGDIINNWDLKLSKKPMDLEVNAGAYEGEFDLSGLSLTRFTVHDGASKSKIIINQPNPVVMEEFVYKTGASNVELINIGNSNAGRFSFEGGTGLYILDFSGSLKQDLSARISVGASDLTLVIPAGMVSEIEIAGGMTNINLEGEWNISGSRYETKGSGPKLTVFLDIGLGNLKLVHK